MQRVGLSELIAILFVGVVLFHGDGFRRVVEAMSQFKGGGPGSPSHPIPADDSRILNRKRKQPDQRPE